MTQPVLPGFPELDNLPPIVPEEERDPQRSFSQWQRDILFRIANGRCQRCGVELTAEMAWHADHVIPHSRGGRTTISNGQALCPLCNLTKSAATGESPFDLFREHTVVGEWPESLRHLRRWSVEFLEDWVQHPDPDYLLVACPAAGKTVAALAAAHLRFQWGEIDRLVTVVPTDAVRKQWYDTGLLLGFQLADEFVGRPIPHYLNGMVITFQSLVHNRERLADLCRNERVMLIVDEAHHASERRAWGHALSDAISDQGALFQLFLSGTPWRSDEHAIAGLRLQPDPEDDTSLRVEYDYHYSYRRALEDGDVVRECYFPAMDGQMDWISRYAPREVQSRSFADPVRRGEAKERLRTFLWALSGDRVTGDSLRSMLANADERLTEIQHDGDVRAQALVIGIDTTHAREIRDALADIIGHQPPLVISDEPNSSVTLDNFKDSDERWIVAVRMISEGYDNRRLRVGVYASTWQTDLNFRQFVGRFTRYNADLGSMRSQPAFVYLPADPQLVAFARAVNEDVDVGYTRVSIANTAPAWAGDEVVRVPRRPSRRNPNQFRPLHSQADVTHIFGPTGPLTAVERADIQHFLDARLRTEPEYSQEHHEFAILLRNLQNWRGENVA